MGYRLIRFLPGIQVHWNVNGTLWGTRDYDIVASSDRGQTWDCVTTLPARPAQRMLTRFGLSRRLLRLGVRSYLQVTNQEFIVFSNKDIFLWREGDIQRIGSVRRGTGPLLQGCCSDDQGNCYYGEYWRNPERQEVNVYTWRRGATEWELFYSFPNGTIRHVHAVQFDPLSKKVWIATGDRDDECRIAYFDTSGVAAELVTIASGKQTARAVSLIFTQDYVYWGSDTGGRGHSAEANYIYRWSRHTLHVEQVASIGGPVYYSTVDEKGRLFVSTTVEGGASEKDHFARVWMSVDGLNWMEIGRWKKDRYPFIFGYGVLSFPQGLPSSAGVYVVGHGVRGGPGTWVLDSDDGLP